MTTDAQDRAIEQIAIIHGDLAVTKKDCGRGEIRVRAQDGSGYTFVSAEGNYRWRRKRDRWRPETTS